MTDIKTEHEGWKITYSEYSNRWEATKTITTDGVAETKRLTSGSLADLKTNIKRYNAKRQKAKGIRIKCLRTYGDGFIEGVITSIYKESSWQGLMVRTTFVYENNVKRRDTVAIKELFKDTEDNRKLFANRKELLAQVRNIESKLLDSIKDKDIAELDSDEADDV